MLDSEGVERRRRQNLTRRIYTSKGPNFLIHVDGYDKLKRFGFAIHGAMCGYSRRVLWLMVARTNNNPQVVASYFLDYMKEIKGVPRCVRMDAGTENVVIEDIQKSFRWEDADDMSAEKSVIIGSSYSNQRIERWWRWARQGGCQYWMDLFLNLEMTGHLSTSNELHLECARFCFMDILQKELDRVRMEWNQHQISRNDNISVPCGKPDIMFYMPSLYGTFDYKMSVDQTDIEAIQQQCQVPFSLGCREDVHRLLSTHMSDMNLRRPSTIEEALSLFEKLAGHF
ncbi:uncharacterized protein [Argopecten irradians]|uniref:uncharacterized protein n=1 Tax=Argopecten irradians TaxID=31199 RepID=UPI0037117CA0